MMNEYMIYIGLMVFGFVLIAMGGILCLLEGKNLKKTITSTVLGCTQAEQVVNGMYLTCYEILIQFYIGDRSIQKVIKRGNKMEEGERLNIFYNEAKDEVCLQEVEKKNVNPAPKIMAILGLLVIIVAIILAVIKMPEMDEDTKANLFAIVFLSLFTCVGLYLCVYTPYKRNKRNLYCDTIKGVLVDFYRDRSRRGSTSYMPIYEYTSDGEKKKLRGQAGGTNKKYRQKGRIVTLAVDRETKKAYCIEDEKGIVIIGWIVVAFTQAIVMMLISTM